ncbi:MAG: indolepyruvate ferredoxin oxidoreductase subunit beta [Candidatus Odinarchaeota archaeon]
MSEEKDRYEILFCGVGGQGILTITDIICNAALNKGLRVRGSETHGMAQRGGSVVSNVRIGEDVYAPLIPERSSDVIISLEPVEALRYAKYVKPEGYIIFNIYAIPPPNLNLSHMSSGSYPPLERLLDNLKEFTRNHLNINATKLAEEAGAVITQNIVLLGAFAALENSPLTKEDLIAELKRYIRPKFIEMNLKAFESGYQEAMSQLKPKDTE